MAVTKLTNSSITGTQKYISMLAGNEAYNPAGFVSIATATPSASIVTFDNIPQTYQHLQIRVLGKRNASVTNSGMFLKLNNVATGTPYDFHYLQGDGSTTLASGQASANFIQIFECLTGNSADSNTFGVTIIDIHDYSNTSKNTTIRAIGGNDRNGAGHITLNSALYRSTNAITRIDFDVITYTAGTVFALYGIKAA